MKQHLYMKEGNALKKDDVKKFRDIHAWFIANPRRLDIPSMTANTRFLERDIELGNAPSGLLKKRRFKKGKKQNYIVHPLLHCLFLINILDWETHHLV